MEFCVPCECGREITVSEGAAGTEVVCTCGRVAKVPSLRKLRQSSPLHHSRWSGKSMRHKIGLAISCLHISAVLYLIVGVLMFALFTRDKDETGLGLAFAIGTLLFCLALIAGIEFVVYGLRNRKFWAWVAGLCVFGVYLPSLFFPLGALGLWGLLDSGSRAAFGVGG